MRAVVDTHLHFWDLARLTYPWLDAPGVEHLRSGHGPLDWRRDAEGADVDVVATVHVQAEMDHALDPALETAWLAELRHEHGAPDAVIGYADLRDPHLRDVLDRHAAFPGFRGIRQEAWFDPASRRADIPTTNLLDDPRWAAGLGVLAERGLVFDLLVWHRQLPQAAELFARHPGLTVVVDHLAVPDADVAGWRAHLAAFLDRVPSAVLKISGLGFADPAWRPEVVDPLIRTALDLAGPDRCVLASNLPVERGGIAYAGIWRTFERAAAHLAPHEQDTLFRGTAERVYGL